MELLQQIISYFMVEHTSDDLLSRICVWAVNFTTLATLAAMIFVTVMGLYKLARSIGDVSRPEIIPPTDLI